MTDESMSYLDALKEIKRLKETLDKIRAEIENDWQFKKFPRSPWSCGLRRALEIIDKYRGDTDGKDSN